jgi:protein-S-isoprenylcysteine O-methyltransferase Ste14
MTMGSVARALAVTMWLLWAYPYVFRAPKIQRRQSITVAGPSLEGLLLETAAIFMVWIFRVPGGWRENPALLALALLLGITGDVLMWTAITHLGRQFRIQAGLFQDHELVRSGPYTVVRHPIYASLLAMTLATGLLRARWPWLLAALAMFVVGTEIRVRTEDRLLASRFGAEFAEYKKKVPAYLPFVR